jgi:hypothetical protein
MSVVTLAQLTESALLVPILDLDPVTIRLRRVTAHRLWL